MNRRNFIKTTFAAVAALSIGVAIKAKEIVKKVAWGKKEKIHLSAAGGDVVLDFRMLVDIDNVEQINELKVSGFEQLHVPTEKKP